MAPATYAILCAVVAAHLYGPYAEPSAFGDATLTFKVPVWQPFMLPPLYVGSVYHLAYVLLTLFTVGRRLERHLGAFRFLLLVAALLFAVSLLRDGLRFVLWKYQLAFWSTVPPPAPHSGDCFCGLVGTLLALKAVYHGIRPDAAYRLGTVCIQVSFWPGLLLELTHFLLHARGGATFGHVTGVLVGLAVSRLLRDRRWRRHLVPAPTGSGTVVGSSRDYPETPAPGLD
ncbi:rhomboid-related protein 4-like [Rhipicephalus sanguineus]|nr:rhomboid-related protein 4-like [Rhipicephalus sanguineus]